MCKYNTKINQKTYIIYILNLKYSKFLKFATEYRSKCSATVPTKPLSSLTCYITTVATA